MALEHPHTVLSNRLPWPLNHFFARSHMHGPGAIGWRPEGRDGAKRSAAVAAMLEARAFISAALPLRLGEGRVFISSRNGHFSKSDALFLAHLMEQIFPVIETIEVLDRMASEAAATERLKISLDLHDTAVQPYIGLRMGLCALRKKAAADNPLLEDLDKLAEVASGVIADLRRFAGAVKAGPESSCGLVLHQLYSQAARIQGLYGIEISVNVEGHVRLDDRMTAEVLQMVGEGLNNICKHTQARRGSVRIGCRNGCLHLRIENEGDEENFAPFRPRSLSDRAAALGGRAQVSRCRGGGTEVLIEIPI
ncbi:sensor histidine kinase [Variovorax boronicumulans]|nr:histidine kinase [Variovorax boronicumulans]